MDPSLEAQADRVLGVVARAQKVFGGDGAPVTPPDLATDRSAEDDLGRGYF